MSVTRRPVWMIWLVVFGVASAVLVIGASLMIARGRQAEAPRSDSRLEAIESRVDHLQSQLNAERRKALMLAARGQIDSANNANSRIAAASHEQRASDEALNFEASRGAIDDEIGLAKDAQLGHARQLAVEEALASEIRDRNWASETEAQIRHWYAALDPGQFEGTVLEELDCRSTLCKIVLRQGGKGQQLAVARTLSVKGLPRGFGRFENENGQWITRLYLVREGAQMPGPRRYEDIAPESLEGTAAQEF